MNISEQHTDNKSRIQFNADVNVRVVFSGESSDSDKGVGGNLRRRCHSNTNHGVNTSGLLNDGSSHGFSGNFNHNHVVVPGVDDLTSDTMRLSSRKNKLNKRLKGYRTSLAVDASEKLRAEWRTDLAVDAMVTGFTRAGILVDIINTRGLVLAWCRRALVDLCALSVAKKGKSLIDEVDDLKEFKKLLRNAASKSMSLFESVAEESLVNFMLDPTGDIPWEEEPDAGDVLHFDSPQRLKPDYSAAATELKGEVNMVGIDVDKPHMMALRTEFNITGFPTLYYFENGEMKYKYGGENNKEGLIKWLRNPGPPEEPKPESTWEDEAPEITHLHDDTFANFLATHSSVLVIDGEFQFDFNERTADKIVEFMKDPKEPPPPPPPEASWEDMPSEVTHLTDETFKSFLKKKKHALIMFYAPWCGHCKKAKPEFMQAAEKLKDDTKKASCAAHDVNGYPTFKYFNYGKNSQKYMGGREEADFIKFMRDPLNTDPEPSKPPAPSQEEHWNDVAGYENIHFLGEATFDTFIQEHSSVLVMFYAPLKYFKDGKLAFDYGFPRTTEALIAFMKDPKEPPPPPKPEAAWSTVQSNVKHLTGTDFSDFTAAKQAVLVMFYAPWCGHCKKSKPAYQAAADKLADDSKAFAAVDCTGTENKELCEKEGVQGFPTIKLYVKGKFLTEYNGDRTEEEFYKFVLNAPAPKEEL
ncbi:PDIA5-like protein [Mya arenaria]|uniref:PDIA5-like protein n=1 Tax=Mya arenaria TaxID=6604 RepID=A0ABY7E741_MYAAR|nr:PDIA5-like protein [Mya arenaria]